MPAIVIMGVSGSGKTTVGKLLAARTGMSFLDADDFHSRASIAKMEAGIALQEEDRLPWLKELNTTLKDYLHKGKDVILACSALKAAYRQQLGMELPQPIQWVYLKGDDATLQQRMQERKSHFMPPQLLQSQLETLEEPEEALMFSIEKTPEEIVEGILKGMGIQRKKNG